MIVNQHTIDGKVYKRVYIGDKPTHYWYNVDKPDVVLNIRVSKVDKYGRVQVTAGGKRFKVKPSLSQK